MALSPASTLIMGVWLVLELNISSFVSQRAGGQAKNRVHLWQTHYVSCGRFTMAISGNSAARRQFLVMVKRQHDIKQEVN